MVLDLISASYIGWPNPAFVSLMIDNAKVRRLSYTSKFCPSIWGDFQHEFGEFERSVISSPRIRNFRAFEITFRR